MSESTHESTHENLADPVARRRLILGGAAAAGTVVAAISRPEPAAASHVTDIAYDSQSVMHVDVSNTTTGSTRIIGNNSGTAAFVANNDYGVGISRPDGILGRTGYSTANCAGVAGASQAASGGIGVLGGSVSATGTGVYGYAGSVVPSTVAPGGTGVYASGPSYGVVAVARDLTGIALKATGPGGGAAALLEGSVQINGATAVEGALAASTVRAEDGLSLPRTAGKVKLGARRKRAVVSGVPLTPDSIVIATLQQARRGVHVAAARSNAGKQQVTISFNKRAPKGTVVGWVVIG